MTGAIAVTAHTLLSPRQLVEVGALAAQLRAAGVDPRLNLEWLASRDGAREADWLASQGGRLVGAAASEAFGDTLEVTLLADAEAPATLLDELLDAVCAGARAQGRRRLLLLHDRAAAAVRALAERRGLQHSHAELVMCRPADLAPPPPAPGPLSVRRVSADDIPLVARTLADGWGGDADELAQRLRDQIGQPTIAYYLALLGDEPVAALNVQTLEGRPWVYGFVVREAHRGRGHGRQLLTAALAEVLAESPGEAFLEVEPDNLPAVRLYRSLGFAGQRTFDYWAKELTDDTHS